MTMRLPRPEGDLADLIARSHPALDWEQLRARARELCAKAHAPYSGYRVGAAALVEDGRIVAGCNVENASYGLTLCAECGLVSDLIASGGGRLVAFSCVNAAGDLIMPCGRCRQLLSEHGGPTLLLDTPQGVRTLDQVLPQAFGADHLASPAPHPAD